MFVCVSVIHISIYWYTHQYIMQYISPKRTHWLKKYKNLASFPNLNSKNKTTKGAAYPKCIMWNNKHIQNVNLHPISLVLSYHIRPIYNGETLRYCCEESMFARSWVFCKQIAEPKAKSLFRWSLPRWWTPNNGLFSLGVETSGYTLTDSIWTSEYSVRTRNFTFKTYSLHSSETGLLER